MALPDVNSLGDLLIWANEKSGSWLFAGFLAAEWMLTYALFSRFGKGRAVAASSFFVLLSAWAMNLAGLVGWEWVVMSALGLFAGVLAVAFER